MKKMSNREKNMLYLLAVVCILAVGYQFFIKPQLTILEEQGKRYEELTDVKEVLDTVSAETVKIIGNYDENVVHLDELKDRIRDYQQDELLDHKMSELIKKCNLNTEVLEINREVSEYLPEGLEAITAKAVKISVYGDMEDFIALEKILYDQTDVVISDLTIATDAATVNQYKVRYGVAADGVMHIAVVVYMKAED